MLDNRSLMYLFEAAVPENGISRVGDPLNVEAYPSDVVFGRGMQAYLAAGQQIVEVDFTVPQLSVAGRYQNNNLNAGKIAVNDDYVFAGGTGGLWIVSLPISENSQLVGRWEREGMINALCVEGDNCFLTAYDWNQNLSSFIVLNVFDPANPAEVASRDLRGIPGDCITYQDNCVFIAGGIDGGVSVYSVRNPEAPEEWCFYDTPGDARDLVLSGRNIFVADRTNFGSYFYSDPISVPKEDFESAPRCLLLDPAYPNPFNAATTIAFTLPSRESASLRIFDPSGRLVETLMEGVQHSGRHEIVWNAKNLPTGLYFAQLKAGNQARIGQVLLVR